MTVIYDEALAAKNVRRLQQKENAHRILFALSCVGMFGLSALLAFSITGYEKPAWLLWVAGPIGIVSLPYWLATATGHFEKDPSPDIVYYEKSKESRILDVNIERHDHGWHRNVPFVVLRTEDANGLVEKTELCIAKYQESTKHNQTTFDVNKGIVFVPYNKGV